MSDGIDDLSTPEPTATRHTLSFLSPLAFSAVMSSILGRYGDLLDTAGSNLREAIAGADAQAGADFETAWSPGVGFARDGLRHRSEEHILIAVALSLLHAASHGLRSEWEVNFSRPVRLPVRDVVLPAARTLRVHTATGKGFITTIDDGSSQTLQLWPDAADAAQSPAVDALKTLGSGRSLIVLWPEAARLADLPTNALAGVTDVVTSCRDAHLGAMRASFGLLERVAPLYYLWVTLVMRRILVATAPPSVQRSGTFDGHVGVCYMSESSEPVPIAEMLVHEASHQYYGMARLFGPTVEKDQNTFHYSPFQRRDRPLDRLLVAYRAFANVLLFYDRCIAAGEHVLRGHIARLRDDVMSTEEVLVGQRDALTPVGASLFAPLYERLQNERCHIEYQAS